MRFASVALIAALLAGAPARSDYYLFTGALSFPEGSRRFLPRSGSISGSGVAFSSVAPSNEIHLSVVNGFTGTLSTVFGSTAGYSQQAFLTQVGKGDFSDPGPGNLRVAAQLEPHREEIDERHLEQQRRAHGRAHARAAGGAAPHRPARVEWQEQRPEQQQA